MRGYHTNCNGPDVLLSILGRLLGYSCAYTAWPRKEEDIGPLLWRLHVRGPTAGLISKLARLCHRSSPSSDRGQYIRRYLAFRNSSFAITLDTMSPLVPSSTYSLHLFHFLTPSSVIPNAGSPPSRSLGRHLVSVSF